jgi:hypothetical protein
MKDARDKAVGACEKCWQEEKAVEAVKKKEVVLIQFVK